MAARKLSHVSTTTARKGLRELLNRVEYGRESIGLVRHGKVCALLVPYAIGDDATYEGVTTEDDATYEESNPFDGES